MPGLAGVGGAHVAAVAAVLPAARGALAGRAVHFRSLLEIHGTLLANLGVVLDGFGGAPSTLGLQLVCRVLCRETAWTPITLWCKVTSVRRLRLRDVALSRDGASGK